MECYFPWVSITLGIAWLDAFPSLLTLCSFYVKLCRWVRRTWWRGQSQQSHPYLSPLITWKGLNFWIDIYSCTYHSELRLQIQSRYTLEWGQTFIQRGKDMLPSFSISRQGKAHGGGDSNWGTKPAMYKISLKWEKSLFYIFLYCGTGKNQGVDLWQPKG